MKRNNFTPIFPHPSTAGMTCSERLECYVERQRNGLEIFTGRKLTIEERINYDTELYALPNGSIISKKMARRIG